MKRPSYLFLGCLLFLALCGCNKYNEVKPPSNPAYLRVFNSIPYTQSAISAQALPFLCFLMDPTFDASGIPNGGGTVGDWLQVRELYTTSYPMDAGTALNAGNGQYTNNPGNPTIDYITNANYDYPGKLHVPTAPDMNGLDLSAWAQVPSGKHRILFVSRSQDNTPFGQLAAGIRKGVLIDTTLDFTAGHVYTLEATMANIDSSRYGAYVRDEQFAHQQFDSGHLYTAFYNVSGTPSFLATNPEFPDYYFLTDTLSVYYTYYINDDNYTGSQNNQVQPPATPLNTANNVFLGTVIRGRDDLSVLTPMPFLAQNYYYTQQAVLRTYWEGPGANSGTMPFVGFSFVRSASQPYGNYPELECMIDPAVYNNFSPDQVNNSNEINNYGVIDVNKFSYQVGLFQVVQSAGSTTVYPTINIFEMIYNRVYLMQVTHQFNNVPD
jgi:hypothetical protein